MKHEKLTKLTKKANRRYYVEPMTEEGKSGGNVAFEKIVDAREEAKACLDDGYSVVYIWDGDEEDAFSHYDPLEMLKK